MMSISPQKFRGGRTEFLKNEWDLLYYIKYHLRSEINAEQAIKCIYLYKHFFQSNCLTVQP